MPTEKPKRTKAPRPIRTLGGNPSASTPVSAAQPANWDEWERRLSAELWEAVALALDIEPASVSVDWGNYADPFADYAALAGKIRIACDHAENGRLKCFEEWPNHPSRNKVELRGFGKWATSLGWELPARFPTNPAAPDGGLRIAPTSTIDNAITAVYNDAETKREKPPNVNEVVAPVQEKLRVDGYKASKEHIQKIAADAKHAERRLPVGATLKNKPKE